MGWAETVRVIVNGKQYACFCTKIGIEAFPANSHHPVWRGGGVTPNLSPEALSAVLQQMARAVVAHAYGVEAADL